MSAPEMTPMRELAALMHEFFLSYIEAGFTEDQALKLVSIIVSESAPKGDAS